jgi:hypothetical protein
MVDASALQREVWGWLNEILISPVFVAEHVERLRNKLAGDVPDATRRLAVLERRQGEVRAGMNKYFGMIEASEDRTRDAVLLERVRALRAELDGIEAESTELRAKAASLPTETISVERVQEYLAKLRARVDDRPEYQRALFHEFRREHDLRVKPLSVREFVISLALRADELLGRATPERLFTVVAPTPSSRGSEGTGSPTPNGPRLLLGGLLRSTRGRLAGRLLLLLRGDAPFLLQDGGPAEQRGASGAGALDVDARLAQRGGETVEPFKQPLVRADVEPRVTVASHGR